MALEQVWQRVRRLNRYVEEQAPWKLAKDPERAGELDRVLRTLAEGMRTVAVLLWPYLPDSCERLLGALGAPELSLAGAALTPGNVREVTAIPSLFPNDSARGMIDSPTHLDLCEPPNTELVAAGEAAGCAVLTVGTDGASSRARSPPPRLPAGLRRRRPAPELGAPLRRRPPPRN